LPLLGRSWSFLPVAARRTGAVVDLGTCLRLNARGRVSAPWSRVPPQAMRLGRRRRVRMCRPARLEGRWGRRPIRRLGVFGPFGSVPPPSATPTRRVRIPTGWRGTRILHRRRLPICERLSVEACLLRASVLSDRYQDRKQRNRHHYPSDSKCRESDQKPDERKHAAADDPKDTPGVVGSGHSDRSYAYVSRRSRSVPWDRLWTGCDWAVGSLATSPGPGASSAPVVAVDASHSNAVRIVELGFDALRDRPQRRCRRLTAAMRS
jgi:hypothetical protein